MLPVVAGGGEPQQSIVLDKWVRDQVFLRRDQFETDIAFLPFALGDNPDDIDEGFEWFRNRDAFRGLRVRMCSDASSLASTLHGAAAVFIMGGNTFTLTAKLRKEVGLTAFSNLLTGKLVYGCSAGAILLGSSILTARLGSEADTNEVQLAEFNGLEAIGRVNVLPHFLEADAEGVRDFVESERVPCIGVPEEGGGYWRDGMLHNVGAVSISIFLPSAALMRIPPQASFDLREYLV